MFLRSGRAVWGALLAVPLLLAGFDRLVYPALTSRLPAGVGERLAMTDRPLAQSSKAGTSPAGDYLALLGDGHALGYGDGLLAALASGGRPMTPALALHRALNRDVLAFGAAQGGPVQAAVALYGTLEESRATPHPLPPPRQALLLFSEADDFGELLSFIQETVEGEEGFETLLQSPPMQQQLGEMIVKMRGTPIEDGVWRDLSEDLAGRVAEPWEKSWTGLAFLKRLREAKPPALQRLEVKRAEAPPPAGTVNQATVGGKEVFLPDRLAAPPLTMEGGKLQFAGRMFAAVLGYLKQNFPETDLRVVYLPSVVNAYAMSGAQVFIQRDEKDWKERYETALPAQASNALCGLAAMVSRQEGAGFYDARPALREKAREAAIHGPRDWHHLNPQGYEALGAALADYLKQDQRNQGCGAL
ncbi:MAG: hypothetical protein HQL51_02725 [Magnetococcales bacterium]|nr:hypothetical protein [Magnetococcales bacterium]